MALMAQDGAGGRHIGVTASTEAGLELLYVHVADGQISEPMSVVSGVFSLRLTPYTGGSVMAGDGTLLYAYERGQDGELAIGRSQ